jgi:type IV pilus assembly protein PilV
MQKYNFNNDKGFSLIEALIALVILAIGLLAIGLMQIGAMKANTNALGRTDGVAVAQSELDRLRSLPLDDADLQDGGGTNNGIAGLDDGIAAGNSIPNGVGSDSGPKTITGSNGQTYRVFWNVAINDDDGDGDLEDTESRTVRVFVYWEDQKFGLNRTITTTTLGGLYL